MAQFYLVRHGQPDYNPCDERGYIGHGRDLAPLSQEGISQALITALDPRLQNETLLYHPHIQGLYRLLQLSLKRQILI